MSENSGDAVARWSVKGLVDLIPGSSRKLWLTSWIPDLVAAGALRKRGKAWVGRRSAIERALLGASDRQ